MRVCGRKEKTGRAAPRRAALCEPAIELCYDVTRCCFFFLAGHFWYIFDIEKK